MFGTLKLSNINKYLTRQKNRQIFFIQNLNLILEPLAFKPTKIEDHLVIYIHQLQSYQHKNKASPFQETNTKGAIRFQKQIILNSHKNNFYFLNSLWIKISSLKPSKKKEKKRGFKAIVCLNH